MNNKTYPIEGFKPFGESIIWQLNRDYYQNTGIEAWTKGAVPHHITSNSMVGKTYAELIFSFLQDLSSKGQTQEKIYILELGAGHGRLAFHVLKHLERLKDLASVDLPDYCYILSDIVEDNLNFFKNHKQFKTYFEKGQLDFAFFDALDSDEIKLLHAEKTIKQNSLGQPILAIANYFFDSLPNDVFHYKDNTISACTVKVDSKINPKDLPDNLILEQLEITVEDNPISLPLYEDEELNKIITQYKDLLIDSYLFFPKIAINCISRIRKLSKKGLLLISMDKGYNEIRDLQKTGEPDMVTHGSFSFLVNFHAINTYCIKAAGKSLFPAFSSFHLQVACLLFLEDPKSYTQTHLSYQRFVNDFGPDDFNTLKKQIYKNQNGMSLIEILSILRLSANDSVIFTNLLPRIKDLIQRITFNERKRLGQSLHTTWENYFYLNETKDLSFEIGGIFYALGFYQDAINYFNHSINQFGDKADVYYNITLCHYQLRQDEAFLKSLKSIEEKFPNFERISQLRSLDLKAE